MTVAEKTGTAAGMDGAVALRSLTLRNVLSFGAEAKVELGPLNVLIGPNGCGKSNLMDVIALLKAAATGRLGDEFRGGGADWPWNGGAEKLPEMRVQSEWRGMPGGELCLHEMAIQVDEFGAYSIIDEISGHPDHAHMAIRSEYTPPGVSILRAGASVAIRRMKDSAVVPVSGQSAAALPPLAINALLADVEIYRSRWVGRVGKSNPLRGPAHWDVSDGRLTETLDNFAMVLKRVYGDSARKSVVDEKMRELNEDARGLRFINVAKDSADINAVGVALEEASGFVIPAPRMSDGMLNWLFLLTVLLDPNPPALVCIDEPETGLHMDSFPALAELLREASARTQIVITTHSDMLVDCFTHEPEAVVVCDKADGVTQMKRLCAEDFQDWKEDGLGMAWVSGAIGGKRW